MNPNAPDPRSVQGQQPNSNTPPRLFGNYSLSVGFTPTLSGSLSTDDVGDFGFGLDGLDNDQNDPKRRRIARACDLCRRRKIKCDGKNPCTHCQNYNTDCVYHFEQKARKPAKTAKYIEGLENRLGRMEHLLRLSGLLGVDEEGRTDLGVLEQRLAQRASEHESPASDQDRVRAHSQPQAPSCHGTPTRINSPTSNSSPKATVEGDVKQENADSKDVDDLAELMDSLVTNNQGETRYIGSASGFSIFSPKGIQWVSEKTGDTSFQEMLASVSVDDNKWYYWKPEVFTDIFERKTYARLPPKEICLSLLSDFFEHFNHMLPLFHEPTFMHLVDKQYSDDPYEGSGWWASLNVSLAIACRIRCMKGGDPTQDEANGWAYFKNSLGVLSELTMRNTDLLSVQALIAMCIFLQGTPNPQSSFFLLGAAFRQAHSIGLHKRGSGYGFNPLEMEQRKRVFWIAYMCDKDICLRSGRPPAQDDNDWNVELPSEDPEDGVGNIPLPDGEGKTNLFRKMCEFSVIESKVYNRLYSVKASKQPDGELLNTIGELDQELQQWKDSIPVEIRPDHDLNVSQPPLIIHLAVVHFSYYNCLTTIHRRSILHGYWTSRLAQYAIEGRNVQPLNHRVFSSAALCVSAARMSVALLKYIPQGDYSCVWLIIYFPVSALVTLFANVLQNPQDARARPDVKLIGVVVQFLARVCQEEATGSIQRMYYVCKEFEKIALGAIERAEKEMSTRQKRKQERDREKVEKGAEYRHRVDLHGPRKSIASLGETSNENLTSTQPKPQSTSSNPVSSTPLFPSEEPQMNTQNTGFTPNVFGDFGFDQPFDPVLDTYSNHQDIGTGAFSQYATTNDLSSQAPQFMTNNGGQQAPHGVSTQFSSPQGSMGDGMGNTGYQQGYMPQDLWSMPMTFEWDWADLSSNMPFNM